MLSLRIRGGTQFNNAGGGNDHNTVRGESLVTVHSGALRVAAEFPVCRGTDGSAATGGVATSGTALLQSKQLLGTEGLVVDLASGLDQVLQVGAGEEVAEVDKLAVVLVLDIDHTPAVLATADLLAVDDNGLLATDNGEGDDFLYSLVRSLPHKKGVGEKPISYLNLSVDRALLVVELIIIVGVHLQVVERELLLNALLERLALLEGQRVGLGDNGDNVDDVGQLLKNNDIDGLETRFPGV